MVVSLKDNRRYILRFDKNDDVLEGIAAFMEREHMQACTFNAIGTASEVELGFYNAFLKEYRKKRFLENVEIVGLIGNGAIFETDKKPIIHAHGTFGRVDFSTIAGHVFGLKTLATCEVFLIQLDGQLYRKQDAEFNLNLLHEHHE